MQATKTGTKVIGFSAGDTIAIERTANGSWLVSWSEVDIQHGIKIRETPRTVRREYFFSAESAMDFVHILEKISGMSANAADYAILTESWLLGKDENHV
jgi:hypothetical protein